MATAQCWNDPFGLAGAFHGVTTVFGDVAKTEPGSPDRLDDLAVSLDLLDEAHRALVVRDRPREA